MGCDQIIADRNSLTDMEQASGTTDYDVIIDTSAYHLHQTQLAWESFSPKTKQWIHLSSAAVYRERDPHSPHPESDETGGATIWGSYGQEKSAIDHFLAEQSEDIPVTILRPPYIYGPKNNVDRETFVWSRSLDHHPILLPDTGTAPIQFLHVDDLASAFLSCIDQTPLHPCNIYNVAADEIVTLREWADILIRTCGGDPQHIYELKEKGDGYAVREYFPFRDHPCCLDSTKIKRELTWSAQYGIKAGFAQTYQTYTPQQLREYLSKMSDTETKLAALLKNAPHI
jgi:nucleoside-diphosphate-sugar epimerase